MPASIGGTPTGTTGTGVTALSVSHTASGADRAVWIGCGVSAVSPPTINSATYNSVAAAAAYASINGGGFSFNRAFYLAGDGSIPTSAVTAQVNFGSTADEAIMSVISSQGVDSTTPVGTAATSNTNSATPSVTVGSVAADDFLCDFVYAFSGPTAAASAPGANQTLGTEHEVAGGVYGGSSYQDGADGGVMSWSLSSAPDTETTLGAIAFKPSVAGTAALTGTATASITEADIV